MTQPLQAPRMVARVGTMPKNHQKRYDDGTRTWQSMTKLLECIETDRWNLDEWFANMTAVGLSMRPDLILGVSAAAQFDPVSGKLTKEAKDAIRGLRRQALDVAKGRAGANQGTAIHTATERLDLGETLEGIGLPYPFDADLRAYDVLKRAMDLTYDPRHVERTVRVPDLDVCGSFDRLGTCRWLEERGMIAPGELVVVDVKTEGAPLLNLIHIAPQMAGYVHGDGMWDPAISDFEPMPAINQHIGLIIHVRDGAATPYVVNLGAGWKSALRAAEQRDELKASKRRLGEAGAWVMALDVKLPAATELVARQAQAELAAAARERAEALARNALAAMSGEVIPSTIAEASGGSFVHNVDGTATEIRGEVAVKLDNGMTTFAPATADDTRERETIRLAIEAIGTAATLQDLAAIYDRVTAGGVKWEGEVARAGDYRGRIVQCPQRELHTAGRCACGWREGLVA